MTQSSENGDGNAEDIVKRYKELIMVAKTKATHETVPSVCLRISTGIRKLSDKIDSVNTGKQVLCQEDSVTFVDNDPASI